MGNTLKTRSQWVWISIIIVVTGILAGAVLWGSKAETTENAEQEHAHQENEKEGAEGEKEQAEDEEKLTLTNEQMQQQNVKLAQVALG